MDPPQFSEHLANYIQANLSNYNDGGDMIRDNEYNKENIHPSLPGRPHPTQLGHYTASSPVVQMTPCSVGSESSATLQTSVTGALNAPSLNGSWLNTDRTNENRNPFNHLSNASIDADCGIMMRAARGSTSRLSTSGCQVNMTNFGSKGTQINDEYATCSSASNSIGYDVNAGLHSVNHPNPNRAPFVHRQLPSVEAIIAKRAHQPPTSANNLFGQGVEMIEKSAHYVAQPIDNQFASTSSNYRLPMANLHNEHQQKAPKKLRQLPIITPLGPQPLNSNGRHDISMQKPAVLKSIQTDNTSQQPKLRNSHFLSEMKDTFRHGQVTSTNQSPINITSSRRDIQSITQERGDSKMQQHRQLPIITKQGVLRLRNSSGPSEIVFLPTKSISSVIIKDEEKRLYGQKRSNYEEVEDYYDDEIDKSDSSQDNCSEIDETGPGTISRCDSNRLHLAHQRHKRISLGSGVDDDDCDDSLARRGATLVDGEGCTITSDETSLDIKSDDRSSDIDYSSNHIRQTHTLHDRDDESSLSSDGDYVNHNEQNFDEVVTEASLESMEQDKDSYFIEPVVEEDGEFFSALATVPEEESHSSEREEEDTETEIYSETNQLKPQASTIEENEQEQPLYKRDGLQQPDTEQHEVDLQNQTEADDSVKLTDNSNTNNNKKLPTIVENGFEAQVMQYIAGKTGLRRGELFSVDEEPSSFNDDSESRSSRRTDRTLDRDSDNSNNKRMIEVAENQDYYSQQEMINDTSREQMVGNDKTELRQGDVSFVLSGQDRKNNRSEKHLNRTTTFEDDSSVMGACEKENYGDRTGSMQYADQILEVNNLSSDQQQQIDRNVYELEQELGDEQILMSPSNAIKTSLEQEEYDEQYRDINNLDDLDRRATNHVHAIDGHSKSMLNDIHQQQTIFEYYDDGDDDNLKGQTEEKGVTNFISSSLEEQQKQQNSNGAQFMGFDERYDGEIQFDIEQNVPSEARVTYEIDQLLPDKAHAGIEQDYQNDQYSDRASYHEETTFEQQQQLLQEEDPRQIDEVKSELGRKTPQQTIIKDEIVHGEYEGNLPRARIMWMTAVSKIVNRDGGVSRNSYGTNRVTYFLLMLSMSFRSGLDQEKKELITCMQHT